MHVFVVAERKLAIGKGKGGCSRMGSKRGTKSQEMVSTINFEHSNRRRGDKNKSDFNSGLLCLTLLKLGAHNW